MRREWRQHSAGEQECPGAESQVSGSANGLEREKSMSELSVGLLSGSFPFLRGGDRRGLIKG